MKILLLFILLSMAGLPTYSQNNYAVSFNGASSANLGSGPALNITGTGITLEAWIYPTAFAVNHWENSIVAKERGNITGYVLRCGGAGRLSLAIAVTGNIWVEVISANNVLALDKWQHVAAVYDGSNVTIYRDGVVVGSVAENRQMISDISMPASIGQSQINMSPERHFTGSIDEVRIWNVARPQVAIKQDMFRHVSTGTGLVTSHQMSDGGGTTVTDNSGNGHTATLSAGTSWVASPIQYAGNALSFDGTNDAVLIPHNTSLNITTAITLEAWVYASKNTGVQNVISKSSSTENYGYIFPRTDNGWSDVTLYLHIGGGWRVLSATYGALNSWHHLAATYDGATMKIFIDGILSGSKAQTGAISTNNSFLMLGVQQGYLAEFFGGTADEFRIWNVARTQTQIQANMNTELDPATQTGLVSYYNVNQGIAGGNNTGLVTLMDQSGSNNGSLDKFLVSGGSSNFVLQPNTFTTLPLTWLSFTAQLEAHHALLKWSTTGERHTRDFIIQRNNNKNDWVDVGNVAAAGNSNQINHYRFSDPSITGNITFYRIMQRDLDGHASYSLVRTIRMHEKKSLFTILGNPVTNGKLTVAINNGPIVLSVYDTNGRIVWKKRVNAGNITIDVGNLVKGIYLVKANDQAARLMLQ